MHSPFKRGCGKPMTQAGGTVDLGVSVPLRTCVRKPLLYLVRTSASSVPLRSSELFKPVRQMQNVKRENDLRTHVVKCSHFTGENTKAQTGEV